MISTCTNVNPWTLPESEKVGKDYLNGKSIDCIAEECKRHENAVCLELIRQGLMHEKSPENVSIRHTHFEYGHFDNASDSDEEIESEYDMYDLNVYFNLIEYLFDETKKGISRFFSFFV